MFEVPPPYRYATHIEVNMLRIVLLRRPVTMTPLGTGKRVAVGDWHSNRSYFAVCNASWGLQTLSGTVTLTAVTLTKDLCTIFVAKL